MILNIAVVFFVCFTGYVNGFTMFKLKTSSEFSIEKTITRIGKPYSYQSMVNSKSQPYTNILKMSNNENSSNNNNNSGTGKIRAGSGERGMKGYYRRPSRAIEQGGGFFVPGLEGEKIRYISAGAILIALAVTTTAGNTNGDNVFDDLQLLCTQGVGVLMILLLFIQGIPESLIPTTNDDFYSNDDTMIGNSRDIVVTKSSGSGSNSNSNSSNKLIQLAKEIFTVTTGIRYVKVVSTTATTTTTTTTTNDNNSSHNEVTLLEMAPGTYQSSSSLLSSYTGSSSSSSNNNNNNSSKYELLSPLPSELDLPPSCDAAIIIPINSGSDSDSSSSSSSSSGGGGSSVIWCIGSSDREALVADADWLVNVAIGITQASME